MSAPTHDIAERPLNPVQRATFDQLLAVGGERPYAPAGLVEELTARIESGTAAALRRWTEPSLWLSKSQLFSALGCEGAFVANRARPPATSMIAPTAVGLVVHRAIQLTHTHPALPIEDVVRSAVRGTLSDEKFAAFWAEADPSAQSDVLMAATSMVTGFLDSWPRLHPSWAPRFEEPLQARVGKLTLSGRVDLLLGRPRPDGRQTMVVADWKSNGLKDEHVDEASFYALVATLRFKVPPFRSCIYSLAAGAWTPPDIDADRLLRSADQVVEAVNVFVETLTEQREPTLTPSRACGWCPLQATCPAAAQAPAA